MMHDQRTEARITQDLCIGIDIGSIACKIVLTDTEGTIIDSSYTRTFGKPLICAVKQLEDMFEKHRDARGDQTASRQRAAFLDVHRFTPWAHEGRLEHRG